MQDPPLVLSARSRTWRSPGLLPAPTTDIHCQVLLQFPSPTTKPTTCDCVSLPAFCTPNQSRPVPHQTSLLETSSNVSCASARGQTSSPPLPPAIMTVYSFYIFDRHSTQSTSVTKLSQHFRAQRLTSFIFYYSRLHILQIMDSRLQPPSKLQRRQRRRDHGGHNRVAAAQLNVF